MLEDLDNRIQHFDQVEAFVDRIWNIRFEDLADEVIEAAQIFIMDTIAVGVAGRVYDATDSALKAATLWGSGDTPVVGRPGVKLPRPSAAFVNGMQVHCLEWDGLHEPSVVIAMCAPVSAFMAEISDRNVSGKQLILATVIAIETAVFFGGDTDNGPRFFRPSVAGGMGAAAGLAVLRRFGPEQLIHTLGLAHAQTSGTMQAHWEGSMALPMQIGNAARMAHMSADMVASGMTGPVDFIQGRFGFFKLFESVDSVETLISGIGQPYKITEMAHKPFPAGRATQATLTMISEIRRVHQFEASDIARVRVYAPPLVIFLVGRPANSDMTPSYARLCLKFVAPLMLMDGGVDPRRYTQAVFADPDIRSLGEKIDICPDGNPDKNALGPQRMEITLNDGRILKADCSDPLGSPDNPLSKQQREDKVRECFALGKERCEQDPGSGSLGSDGAETLINDCHQLSALEDCRVLLSSVS